MSLKSRLGLDAFDLVLQAAITASLLGWIWGTNSEPDAVIGTGVVTTASLVLLGIRRYFGLRRLERRGVTTGEMAAERIAELEQRVEELEAVQARVLELEERLDFTERLLARIPAGQGENR